MTVETHTKFDLAAFKCCFEEWDVQGEQCAGGCAHR